MRLFHRDTHEELRDEAQLEFERQSEVIRSLVSEGSCIILGRCADQLFENHPRALHVFIYASDEERIRNTMELLHTGEEEARALVQNEDRAREAYRRRFSAHPEDEVAGRHILLDSGKLGARKSADILIQAAKYLFYE
jgi:cytidylate kinase